MDLVALLSTGVGAAVALLGAVLGDTLRNRGNRDRDSRAERRTGYLEFLLALDRTHGGLRTLAHADEPSEQLRRDTRRVMSDNGLYEARERLIMSGHAAVVRAGERAFRGLLVVRDAIRQGATLNSAGYHDSYHQYAATLWGLRRAIREDLGVSDLTPADLDKSTWDSRETCAFCQRAEPTSTSSV